MNTKVKLISDGTPIGTKLVDPETLEPLPIMQHVRAIRWRIDEGGLAVCEVDLICIEIDVAGEMEIPEATSKEVNGNGKGQG